ncbi:MAG: metalloregulator ArsR/SmtB family transcription factor [Candidatus Wolfebacteria bacterium]|nr:metalloregulator ArsR/SmtB family transcription factor [Candidatus Wolfebacteria bacterium]
MNMRSYEYKRCRCKTAPKLKDIEFSQVAARQLRIASLPSRMRLLLLLARASHCVCDLMTHTKLSQTLISHHLSGLTKAGLVQNEKSGAFVDYSLTDKGRKLVEAIQTLNS